MRERCRYSLVLLFVDLSLSHLNISLHHKCDSLKSLKALSCVGGLETVLMKFLIDYTSEVEMLSCKSLHVQFIKITRETFKFKQKIGETL